MGAVRLSPSGPTVPGPSDRTGPDESRHEACPSEAQPAVQFSVATWNINSVRLRIAQVGRYLADAQPDILCLQETKCPNDLFPLKGLAAYGYPHIIHHGQKGYNGVAILSKHPFARVDGLSFCEHNHARHLAVTLAAEAGPAAGITVHNFYVPAGGDVPDPALNPKFAHKLGFLDAIRRWGDSGRPTRTPAILVGDLNVAPLEHDVWSHKQLLDVVSHTPVETERLETLRQEAGWIDGARHLTPEPEKLYTWWSYRSPDWAAADKGRRLDHVWTSPDLAGTLQAVEIHRPSRGWERPSDHVPVLARFTL